MEVKCRHEVDDGTGAERWSKTKHSNTIAAAAFLRTERGLDQDGAGLAAGECLAAASAKVRCIRVGKVRTLGGGGGVDSEKTLITATEIADAVPEGGAGGAGSSMPATQWTSYCIEGSTLVAVNAGVSRWLDSFSVGTPAETSVQAKTVAVFGDGTIVGGYPAWLAHLCSAAGRR